MPGNYLIQFIGGLAFFFFGLYSINQALQGFAGDRLKNMIAKTTEGRLKSLVTGILVTFFMQSSSATTVMIVGLTSSGLLMLESAMSVALGAGIGTTLVVLLFSIKGLVDAGIPILTLGMILRFFPRRHSVRLTGHILFSFGFVFFGMTVMAQAVEPLKESSWLPTVFAFLENYPFTNMILAAVITALVHSSGVIMGLLISLAFSGAMTFPVALPLILGANLGTSFTALTVSFKAKTDGKRAALANFLFRTGAVMLVYVLLVPVTEVFHFLNERLIHFLFNSSVTAHTEIALSHFLFNMVVALLFLPLLPLGKKIVCWVIPDNKSEDEDFGPRYLDKEALSTPSLAFAQVSREVVRMGEIAKDMFERALELFQNYNIDLAEQLENEEQKVDTLYKAIKFYLAKLTSHELSEAETEMNIFLMTTTNEWENIGDTVEHHFIRLAHHKWNHGHKFSQEGWKEIGELHRSTVAMMELALNTISTNNRTLARRLLRQVNRYTMEEDRLKMSHLKRLHEKRKESIETSAIHLELISLYHRINMSLLSMVRYLLPDREREVAPSQISEG